MIREALLVDLAAGDVDEDAAKEEDGEKDADDGAQRDGRGVGFPRGEDLAFT